MIIRGLLLYSTAVILLSLYTPFAHATDDQPGLIIKIKTSSRTEILGSSSVVTKTRAKLINQIRGIIQSQQAPLIRFSNQTLIQDSEPQSDPVRSLMNGAGFELLAAKIPMTSDAGTLRNKIQALEGVEYVENDRFLKLLDDQKAEPSTQALSTMDDSDYVNQWWLRPGSLPGGSEFSINVLPVWEKGFLGSRNVIVAVIDSGIDLSHPDLRGNIYVNMAEIPGDRIDNDQNGYIDDVNGWNFFNSTALPTDDFGHGTHVAGIIGAAPNHSVGITGVSHEVSLLPVRVMNERGNALLSDAIQGIQYSIRMRADIINLSMGTSEFAQALYDALNEARRAGILVIASAGNDGSDNDIEPLYPASFALDHIIAVSAIARSGKLAAFSNYGRSAVHLSAPGTSIYSTVPRAKYENMSGTSMSAPMVAGAAALLKSIYPNEDYGQLKRRLIGCARAIAPESRLRIRSGGALDVARAVQGGECTNPTLPKLGLIRALEIRSSSVLLNWDAVPGAEYYSFGLSHGSRPPAACNDQLGIAHHPAKAISGLRANTTYSLRVCGNATGKEESSSVLTFRTALPQIDPIEISRIGSGSADFILRSPDAAVFTYDVLDTYDSKQDVNLPCGKMRFTAEAKSRGNRFVAELKTWNLREKSTYAIIACALSEDGAYSEPLKAQFTTIAGIAPPVVRDIQIKEALITSVVLEWKSLRPDLIYSVRLNDGEAFETSEPRFSFDELAPETAYQARIITVDREQGTASAAVFFHFSTPRPAIRVSAEVLKRDYAELRIDSNFDLSEVSDRAGLTIVIHEKDRAEPLDLLVLTKYDGRYQAFTSIHGLKRGTKYRIVYSGRIGRSEAGMERLAETEFRFTTKGLIFKGHEGW